MLLNKNGALTADGKDPWEKVLFLWCHQSPEDNSSSSQGAHGVTRASHSSCCRLLATLQDGMPLIASASVPGVMQLASEHGAASFQDLLFFLVEWAGLPFGYGLG